MPMTTQNFGNQNQNAGPQDLAGGLSSDSVNVVPVTPGKSVKPADSNGQHFDKSNDYKNTQRG